MSQASTDTEGPPEPTFSYLRRRLMALVEEKQWQRAQDFCDAIAVHPYLNHWRQEWVNGFGDAMHMILLTESTASFRSVLPGGSN